MSYTPAFFFRCDCSGRMQRVDDLPSGSDEENLLWTYRCDTCGVKALVTEEEVERRRKAPYTAEQARNDIKKSLMLPEIWETIHKANERRESAIRVCNHEDLPDNTREALKAAGYTLVEDHGETYIEWY